MITNLSQQTISTWRELHDSGDLTKIYIRYDRYDRVIERVSTKGSVGINGPALRYTSGFKMGDDGDIQAEFYEMVLWTADYENAVSGIMPDGTL
jgi:hypothetical protein